MHIVGLTGGIASGKSTASAVFREEKLAVIDLDAIAHEVTKKGRWGYRRVVSALGEAYLDKNGELDRKKIAEKVFSDKSVLSKLNRASHPAIVVELVLQLIRCWIALKPVVVLDVPLLFESKLDRITSSTVCVWCREDQQVTRMVTRDKCSPAHARARIRAQMPLQAKVQRCDHVVDSSGTKEACEEEARKIARDVYLAKGFRSWIFR